MLWVGLVQLSMSNRHFISIEVLFVDDKLLGCSNLMLSRSWEEYTWQVMELNFPQLD